MAQRVEDLPDAPVLVVLDEDEPVEAFDAWLELLAAGGRLRPMQGRMRSSVTSASSGRPDHKIVDDHLAVRRQRAATKEELVDEEFEDVRLGRAPAAASTCCREVDGPPPASACRDA